MNAERSLWDELQTCGKPIFLYGTGNGGDKIIAALEQHQVSITGVFASDGFVRSRTFHGFPVRSYSEVVEEYGENVVILLAFGTTLPDVVSFIRKLDESHELRIPDVPLYGGELFDLPYFRSHQRELGSARSILADERSRALFDDVVAFRLNGRLSSCLHDTEPLPATLNDLFFRQTIRTVFDGGAFKGDSASEFAEAFAPEIIWAVESDPKTYQKLCAYAASESRSSIHPIHAALWDDDGTLELISSGSRGSGEAGQNHRARVTTVPCARVDTLIADNHVDFLKLDIEGAEARALIGAEETLKRCQPNLALSLYHRTDDLYTLIHRTHELLPSHKLFLRRIPCIPMWDLTLYAVRP